MEKIQMEFGGKKIFHRALQTDQVRCNPKHVDWRTTIHIRATHNQLFFYTLMLCQAESLNLNVNTCERTEKGDSSWAGVRPNAHKTLRNTNLKCTPPTPTVNWFCRIQGQSWIHNKNGTSPPHPCLTSSQKSWDQF